MLTSNDSSSLSTNISRTVNDLKLQFDSGVTRPLTYRQQQLEGLQRFIRECEKDIITALHDDLGKPRAEAILMEIAAAANELKFIRKHLASWMKPKKVSTDLIAQPGSSRIYPEPLGIVLIISPWNFPFLLAMNPLAGALAAGNTVLLKPSEMAPAVSQLLAAKLPQYIDCNSLRIIEGGVAETTAILTEKFDHIFYTGNGHVGRIIMTAAAKHLTPVTLELGGKSPCIVHDDANIQVAARRIVWGKFSNAGQTCVAPDYVLAHHSIERKLLEAMQIAIDDFFGDDPAASKNYARIINTPHLQRLVKLMREGGKVVCGGNYDENSRYMSPTIMHHIPEHSPLLTEEIFGPILPVIPYSDIREAIQIIHDKPKPLSLYLFTSSKSVEEKVLAETSSGGAAINATLMHLSVPTLPFGGVGASGMGAYHGKSSFDTFTHDKSVFKKPVWIDPSFIYPPYPEFILRAIKWLTGA
jgi:aldehyde dehydrogenase (NAD+)